MLVRVSRAAAACVRAGAGEASGGAQETEGILAGAAVSVVVVAVALARVADVILIGRGGGPQAANEAELADAALLRVSAVTESAMVAK